MTVSCVSYSSCRRAKIQVEYIILYLYDQVQAMKLLVRWLLGIRSNAQNSGTSTVRLLYTVIIHEGDLMEQGAIK